MGNFRISHTFATSVDIFWGNLFFDEHYNRRLYLEAMRFKGYELVELKRDPSGVITRRVKAEPDVEAPTVIQKLVGDSMAYEEAGRFDPAKKRWSFTITPSKLADKVHTTGEIWVEARGDKQVERIVMTDLQVKIFGVGKIVESFIEKTTRDSYEKAATFTNKFIAEKNL